MSSKYRIKNFGKIKIVLILVVLLLAVILTVSVFFTPETDVPANMEIEESVDLSFSRWSTVTKQYYTAIQWIDDYISFGDTSTQNMPEMWLNFNQIDVGCFKIQLRSHSDKYLGYFGVNFKGAGNILFKLERVAGIFYLVIDDVGLEIIPYDNEWHTVEIFFDLSDSQNKEVSIDVDGTEVVDSFIIDTIIKGVDTIYMYGSVPEKTYVHMRPENLYNYRKI